MSALTGSMTLTTPTRIDSFGGEIDALPENFVEAVDDSLLELLAPAGPVGWEEDDDEDDDDVLDDEDDLDLGDEDDDFFEDDDDEEGVDGDEEEPAEEE